MNKQKIKEFFKKNLFSIISIIVMVVISISIIALTYSKRKSDYACASLGSPDYSLSFSDVRKGFSGSITRSNIDFLNWELKTSYNYLESSTDTYSCSMIIANGSYDIYITSIDFIKSFNPVSEDNVLPSVNILVSALSPDSSRTIFIRFGLYQAEYSSGIYTYKLFQELDIRYTDYFYRSYDGGQDLFTIIFHLSDESWLYRQGYDRGLTAGFNEGFESGIKQTNGFDLGYSRGYQAGFEDGTKRSDGYEAGVADGIDAGLSQQLKNPIEFLLKPVQEFLNMKLFGVISLGSFVAIGLFVLIAVIFIKMFAGG